MSTETMKPKPSKSSRAIARRNQVALAMFGVVKDLARRKFREGLVSLDDLIQEGITEVLEAIGDHDPARHKTTLVGYVRSRAWKRMERYCRDARRGLPALRESDFAADNSGRTPYDRAGRDESAAARIDARDEVDHLIGAHCSPRESLVLNALYSTGRDPETLTELGREIGIGRDRVRQVRDRAIDSLRSAVNGQRPSVYERAHSRL
jgi:RNA polymerase sigma factor (sigma-70 family)